MPEFQQGESVRYKPIGGTFSSLFYIPPCLCLLCTNSLGPETNSSESVGVIRQVRTTDSNMTNRNVAASSEEPRYEVRYATVLLVGCVMQDIDVKRARSRTSILIRDRLSRNRISLGPRSRIQHMYITHVLQPELAI